MNFLAHLYLSGNHSEIMIGNFIADAVKGKSYQKYSPKIQQGILLHRKIDSFTDSHPVTKELKSLLSPYYDKHSGIVMDIFYDYFLSVNWSQYTSEPLDSFIKKSYRLLLRNIFVLPSKIKAFLPFFIGRNRLKNYSTLEGIENVLNVMSKYTSLPEASKHAVKVLKMNHKQFNEGFRRFFDDLILMVKNEIDSHQRAAV